MVLILSRSCRLRHGWLYSSIRRYPKGVRTITPGKYTGREGREGREGGREGGRGERERNLHIFPSIGISFHLILKCELITHSHTPSLITHSLTPFTNHTLTRTFTNHTLTHTFTNPLYSPLEISKRFKKPVARRPPSPVLRELQSFTFENFADDLVEFFRVSGRHVCFNMIDYLMFIVPSSLPALFGMRVCLCVYSISFIPRTLSIVFTCSCTFPLPLPPSPSLPLPPTPSDTQWLICSV